MADLIPLTTETAAAFSSAHKLIIDPVPVVVAFEKLLASEEFGNRIDGRVAIKRWASIGVVWSQQGEGQLRLLREIHLLATKKRYNNFMTPFQKSRLMTALICICSEAGNQCGVRPPTGGIEQYLRSISAAAISTSEGAVESSRKSGRGEETGSSPGSRKINLLRRADIRDWTTVVIHDYLQNHKKCLQQVCNDSLDEEPEDDRKSASGSNVQDILAPNFSDFITGLCRSASSSVPNSSYSEHSSWNKALLSITAAFCFELAVDPALPRQ